MKNGTLIHYGIKGMKWGIRRYETENGSLTAAGKKRYKEEGALAEDISKSAKEASKIGAGKKSKIVNKKDYSKIPDKELRDRVNRMNLERQYGTLTGDAKAKRTGEEWIRETLQTVGSLAAIAWTIQQIAVYAKKGGVV